MSSETTLKLNLPYILPAQAQKHITHNEALKALDTLIHLSVVSDTLTQPPANPVLGDNYLVGSNASEAWLGKDNQVTTFQDGVWEFLTPQIGWQCYVQDSARVKIWSGTVWTVSNINFNQLGINAEADENNKLSVTSQGSLFSHDGSDHRLIVNKNAQTDTASVVFQTDYSGRAEFGLTGSDNFTIKVSPDGTSFIESLKLDAQSGTVIFPQGQVHAPTGLPIASYLPSPVKEIWRLDMSRPTTPRSYAVGDVSGSVLTLTQPLAATIFSNGMRENAMVRLWNMSKQPYETCWVNYNNSASELNVSDPAHIANWSTGDILQLGDPAGAEQSGLNVLGMVAIDISPYLYNQLGAVFRQKAVTVVTRSHASGGVGRVGLSATGEGGSAFDGYSLSDGQPNNASFTVPCSVGSPISNSNLISLREPLGGGATAHAINFVRVLGVWG